MDETGRELLGLLDGLPLALAQAASYLRETGLDTTSYVRLYKEQWDDLMRSDGESGSPLVDYEQRSIGTTWTACPPQTLLRERSQHYCQPYNRSGWEKEVDLSQAAGCRPYNKLEREKEGDLSVDLGVYMEAARYER